VRLSPGDRLGRYEVVDSLGRGGMGEVYRARDTLLDKMVAIKTVSTGFLDHPAAAPRFEQERKVAAVLEHPHICRLLDAGHENGVDYLAMEYLEGETLSARLTRGRLPLHEALGYAIEIGEALSYAHLHGIIHRDLKPANVFLTSTGVKVLDFGLAKLTQRTSIAPGASQAETAPLGTTTPGAVVGTALYMAPERLEGAVADERTDIFCFGLVVYEMITGRRPFDAPTSAGLMAAVMTADPPAMMSTRDSDEDLEWVVRKCLAKRPDDRWQSMRDVIVLFKRFASQRHRPLAKATGFAAPARVVAVAGAIVVGGLAAWGWFGQRTDTPALPVAFPIYPPAGGSFTPTESSVQAPQLALSPDGSVLAFVGAGPDGVSQIWIRRLDSVTAKPIPDTNDGAYPFWSPDGRSLGFFSNGLLRRIDLAGGPARTLASAPNGRGGAWSIAGTILFSPNATGGLSRVGPEGGDVSAQTRPDPARNETSHRWPHFVDASRYLYYARSSQDASEGVYLASLDSSDVALVANSAFGGVFVPPRWVLFMSGGTLLMRNLDLERRRAFGEPVVVAERVAGSSNFYGAFSASSTGSIAYARTASIVELAWFDRNGRRLYTSGTGSYVDFRVSPDGRYVAAAEIDPQTDRPDLYVLDLERHTRQRLTVSRATDASPVWAPDGRMILFRSNRDQVHDLYRRGVFGTSPEQLFFKSAAAKYPTSWSAAHRAALFHTRDDRTGWDIWLAPIEAPDKSHPVVQTAFTEAQGQFSPDGRWIAYISDETRSMEVYVQSATRDGPRWQVSVAGGFDPHWSPRGSELFYIAADGWLMNVPFRPREAPEPGTPQRLLRMPDVAVLPPYASHYDVAPDGKFLVRIPQEQVRTLPLTVLMNWMAGPGKTH
jgi:eukaryotic-like serine/threonine-protein kinase